MASFRRLAKELEVTTKRFDAECVNDNLSIWQVAIPGPDNTPYFGGTFLVKFEFPSDYPFNPPKICFQTKIYHPNINRKGEVCVGTMTPAYTMSAILDVILDILKNPDSEDPLVAEIGVVLKQNPKIFQDKAQEWTLRYAV